MIMKYIYSKLKITNKFVFNIHDNKFVFNINYGEAQQSYQQWQSIAIFEKRWFRNARNVMMISCWKCATVQRSLWSININRYWFGKLKYNDFVERKSWEAKMDLLTIGIRKDLQPNLIILKNYVNFIQYLFFHLINEIS